MGRKPIKLTEEEIVFTMMFANNLRFIMHNKGLGVTSLAKKMNVNPYEIQKHMRGSAKPSDEFIKNVADALECTVFDLLDENGNPRNFSKTEEEIAVLNERIKKDWEGRV